MFVLLRENDSREDAWADISPLQRSGHDMQPAFRCNLSGSWLSVIKVSGFPQYRYRQHTEAQRCHEKQLRPVCTTSKPVTGVHTCPASPAPLHCPSCKFMAAAVASPKSLRLDLCTFFHVADDSERRQTRQISLRKNGGGEVWERGDRRAQHLNLQLTASSSHSRQPMCRCRYFPRQPPRRERRLTWKLTRPLVSWVIVFH